MATKKKRRKTTKKKTTKKVTAQKKVQSNRARSIPSKKKIVKNKSKKIRKSVLFIGLIIIIVVVLLIINPFGKKSKNNLLIIELKGKDKITLEYGKEYQDEGATATYGETDLTSQIKVDTNINLKKLGTYYYKYSIEYNNKKTEKKREISIVDKTKPKITLNGSDSITVYIGSKYTEKGAKATDNYDGDLTKKIKTAGSVNTKKKGTYTITYSVSDSSKNESSISRKVYVKEKTAKQETVTNNNSTTNTNPPTGTSSKGYKIEKKNGLYYVDGILIVNKTYSLPSTYNPGGLLNIFTYNFNKMKEAASKDGVTLKVISGFRSYNTQKNLYNNYVKADGKAAADRYSARPGHSEHQTGLAADINKIDYSWGTTKEGKWLNDNCYKYGFVIRYTKNGESKTGYKYEPWHIRYLGVDVATKLYNNGNWITLEEYLGITSKYSY